MKKQLLVELANLTSRFVPAKTFFQAAADVAAEIEGLRRIRRIRQIEQTGRVRQLERVEQIERTKGRALKVSVVFVSEKFLMTLNRKFRKQNYRCQELSLAFNDISAGLISGEYLGEIFLAPAGRRLFYAHQFVHALLHILGYNHEGRTAQHKRDAKLMIVLEKKIVGKLRKDGI